MLTRWYIGVNAKSKGFFTGFRLSDWTHVRNCDYDGKPPLPSFTSQGALAKGYKTEELALLTLNNYIIADEKRIDEYKRDINILETSSRKWANISMNERIRACYLSGIRPQAKSRHAFGQNEQYELRDIYLHDRSDDSTLTKEEQNAINTVSPTNLIKSVARLKTHITGYENRIQWVKDKLKVREQEVEFKFKDSERRSIEWSIRGDNDSAHSYCNCCGGAIPNIPQLRIGGRWNNSCLICAICMGKLAEEAKIQLGKVSDEIMDNYTADRFLRDMD